MMGCSPQSKMINQIDYKQIIVVIFYYEMEYHQKVAVQEIMKNYEKDIVKIKQEVAKKMKVPEKDIGVLTATEPEIEVCFHCHPLYVYIRKKCVYQCI